MADIDIGSNSYKSYASVEEADEYLAADANLYAVWAGLTATGAKERALISSSRYLANLTWKDDVVPDYETVPDAVQEASIILAAQVAVKPKILDTLGSGENIKRVKAGTAEVEFFTATVAKALPNRIIAILNDMLGVSDTDLEGLGMPYDAGDGSNKCGDQCEYGLNGPYS